MPSAWVIRRAIQVVLQDDGRRRGIELSLALPPVALA